MLLFGILNLVVTYAMEALNEHHHRGNACPRHFGSIMQRSGREPMTSTARLANGRMAELDEVLIEQYRFNLPEPIPRCIDLAFPRKKFARRLGLLEHPRQGGRIEMALVQGDPALFHDTGHDPRLSGARANRADPSVPLRNAVNLGA